MPTLKTSLKWSPDGCRIEVIPAGEHPELPARVLEIASQVGILIVDGEGTDNNAGQEPEPEPDKADKKSRAR